MESRGTPEKEYEKVYEFEAVHLVKFCLLIVQGLGECVKKCKLIFLGANVRLTGFTTFINKISILLELAFALDFAGFFNV